MGLRRTWLALCTTTVGSVLQNENKEKKKQNSTIFHISYKLKQTENFSVCMYLFECVCVCHCVSYMNRKVIRCRSKREEERCLRSILCLLFISPPLSLPRPGVRVHVFVPWGGKKGQDFYDPFSRLLPRLSMIRSQGLKVKITLKRI